MTRTALGCSGSFGSDSTLRHLWIEHTKTGVWAVQSRRLTIAGCRFRNTVADGCNLCVGVRESLVVDCTARGTGDDGFALWPAVYTDEVYPAGRNRVYRCTAQVPILGNGFAVYGGRDQRIEDCRAEDIPYGCGILVSTAFPAAPFTGTTQIAGCRIVRAGGCDFRTIEDARDRAQAFRWRGSLLLAARRRDLIGIAVTDLTVDASISDAIAFSASTTASLLDCHMEGVRINGTGLGAPGVPFHAWADARGSVRVGGIAIEGGTDASYRIDTSEFTVHPATDP